MICGSPDPFLIFEGGGRLRQTKTVVAAYTTLTITGMEYGHCSQTLVGVPKAIRVGVPFVSFHNHSSYIFKKQQLHCIVLFIH